MDEKKSIAGQIMDYANELLEEHSKGTKVSRKRARKISINLQKLCKEYRSWSISLDKKQ